MDLLAWQNLMCPGIYPLTWLAFASEKGLSSSDIVRRSRLSAEEASGFSAGISQLKLMHLMQDILDQLADHPIGTEIGWRLPPTAFGSLGQAMLASATARDALELCQRYWELLARGISIHVAIHDDQCVLSFVVDVPVDERFRQLLVESTLSSVYRGILALVPESAGRIEVWFDFAEPSYGAFMREKMPGTRFGMPLIQCRTPAALLELPLAMASPIGLQTALMQCELEARALNLRKSFSERVQKELTFSAQGYPSLEQISARLDTSARTLRRRLGEEGRGYSTLLEEARHRDAIRLLANPTLKIAEIADLLGYKDASNFTRAFRKWAGMAPIKFQSCFMQND